MMRLSGAQMGDVEIRNEVLRQLASEARLAGVGVGLRVENGTVTLTGAVPCHDAALAAIEAARRADGVFDVKSELEVDASAGTPRTDMQLAAAVRQALEWDAQIPHRRIQVAVSNGWVALHGRVELLSERENAGRLASRIEGARGVYNLIEVRPAEARQENVRELIEEALRRRARRDAEQISVSLREGTVSLSGKVHTWAEKQAVLGALAHAPGVERVRDELSIDPYF
jgi:osmotically-inducible protein OsmY